MTVTIDLKPEIAQALLSQARELGISQDEYLREIIIRQVRVSDVTRFADTKVPAVPVCHLGEVGPLHRRDIYDDVE